MKALITGCHGQVGMELMSLAATYGYQALGLDHQQLDITHAAAVAAMCAQESPDVVINAAAYTAVDKAESDAAAAWAVNATAVGNLAQACALADIPLLHLSTDYVFDGRKLGAYEEADALCPLGVYGESKLAGEAAVRSGCEKHYILRTSWVFSTHGNNFVKTMLRLGAERSTLGVVADQAGKPTSAREIAHTIYRMLTSKQQAWGTYHLAQPELTTWFGFATQIFAEAKAQGLDMKISQLNPITTADYPTPAKRPANSELNCSKLESTFGIQISPWQESLRVVIREIRGQ